MHLHVCVCQLLLVIDVSQEVKWGNRNKNNCKMEVPWNVSNTSAVIILLWCSLSHTCSSNALNNRLYGTHLSHWFDVFSSGGSIPSVNGVSGCSARLLCLHMLLVPMIHGTEVLCVASHSSKGQDTENRDKSLCL